MSPTIIAYVEAGIIVILLLLIVFRKIGRPLSAAEAQYKIDQKKKRESEKQTRKNEARLDEQRRWNKLQEQETIISKMTAPIILVSAGGDIIVGYDICVKDANGNISNLHAESYEMEDLPRFKGLFNAFGTSWKSGMVLVP